MWKGKVLDNVNTQCGLDDTEKYTTNYYNDMAYDT